MKSADANEPFFWHVMLEEMKMHLDAEEYSQISYEVGRVFGVLKASQVKNPEEDLITIQGHALPPLVVPKEDRLSKREILSIPQLKKELATWNVRHLNQFFTNYLIECALREGCDITNKKMQLIEKKVFNPLLNLIYHAHLRVGDATYQHEVDARGLTSLQTNFKIIQVNIDNIKQSRSYELFYDEAGHLSVIKRPNFLQRLKDHPRSLVSPIPIASVPGLKEKKSHWKKITCIAGGMLFFLLMVLILLYILPAVPFILTAGVGASIVIATFATLSGGLLGYFASLISDDYLSYKAETKNIEQTTLNVHKRLGQPLRSDSDSIKEYKLSSSPQLPQFMNSFNTIHKGKEATRSEDEHPYIARRASI